MNLSYYPSLIKYDCTSALCLSFLQTASVLAEPSRVWHVYSSIIVLELETHNQTTERFSQMDPAITENKKT